MRESVEREDRASKKNARLTAAAVEASEPRIQESANVDEKREEEKRRLAKRRLGRGGHVSAKLPPVHRRPRLDDRIHQLLTSVQPFSEAVRVRIRHAGQAARHRRFCSPLLRDRARNFADAVRLRQSVCCCFKTRTSD